MEYWGKIPHLQKPFNFTLLLNVAAWHSGMPTIFQLNRQELVSLLKFLRPQLDPTRIEFANETKLRLQITEWLLLNGLSTMHHFDKINHEWILPNKADCISCGEYRIGHRKKIYQLYAPTTTEVITQEPEKVQTMHGSISMLSTNNPIQTRHGNHNEVMYMHGHDHEQHLSRSNEKSQEHNGCCSSLACCGTANAADNSCLDLCLVCLFFECLRT